MPLLVPTTPRPSAFVPYTTADCSSGGPPPADPSPEESVALASSWAEPVNSTFALDRLLPVSGHSSFVANSDGASSWGAAPDPSWPASAPKLAFSVTGSGSTPVGSDGDSTGWPACSAASAPASRAASETAATRPVARPLRSTGDAVSPSRGALSGMVASFIARGSPPPGRAAKQRCAMPFRGLPALSLKKTPWPTWAELTKATATRHASSSHSNDLSRGHGGDTSLAMTVGGRFPEPPPHTRPRKEPGVGQPDWSSPLRQDAFPLRGTKTLKSVVPA